MTMKLADTVGDMLSDDPCRRLVAEYNQLVIRIQQLEQYIDGLQSKQSNQYFVLMRQLYCMYNYREALKEHVNYMSNLKEYKGRFKALKSGCVTLATR